MMPVLRCTCRSHQQSEGGQCSPPQRSSPATRATISDICPVGESGERLKSHPSTPGTGMLGSVDSAPGAPYLQRQIGTRFDALRARLKELRDKDRDPARNWALSPTERLEAAQRHAVEAQGAAAQVLASSVMAFHMAAEAHERVASLLETAAASGMDDVHQHERQAALHRAAAVIDRQRAKRAQSLLPGLKLAGPVPVSEEPRNSEAPEQHRPHRNPGKHDRSRH
jgi:hypothetical protein